MFRQKRQPVEGLACMGAFIREKDASVGVLKCNGFVQIPVM